MKVVVCVRAPLGRDERAALALAASLGSDVEVTALAAGPQAEDAALHEALGAGATRAMRLEGEALSSADFHTLGRALAAAVRKLEAELVLTGARSDEEGLGAVAGSLAQHLASTHVARVEAIEPLSGTAVAAHVRGGGLRRKLSVPLPAVLSVTGAGQTLPPASSKRESTGDAPIIRLMTFDQIGLDPHLIRRRETLLGTLEPAPAATIVAKTSEELEKALAGA